MQIKITSKCIYFDKQHVFKISMANKFWQGSQQKIEI